jgi:hypothetical protein
MAPPACQPSATFPLDADAEFAARLAHHDRHQAGIRMGNKGRAALMRDCTTSAVSRSDYISPHLHATQSAPLPSSPTVLGHTHAKTRSTARATTTQRAPLAPHGGQRTRAATHGAPSWVASPSGGDSQPEAASPSWGDSPSSQPRVPSPSGGDSLPGGAHAWICFH